jgi:hypothetical protein
VVAASPACVPRAAGGAQKRALTRDYALEAAAFAEAAAASWDCGRMRRVDAAGRSGLSAASTRLVAAVVA